MIRWPSGPKAQRPRAEYLERDKLAWLLAMQVLLILPLLLNLPIWLWLVWVIAAFWRTQMFRGRWAAPGKLAKGLLTAVCAAGMFASYSGKTGTEAMVGLLVCAFSLKLLEVNAPRDAQLLVFIGFIIAATQLLFSQTPQAAIYCLACVVLLLASWRSLLLTRFQAPVVRLKRGAAILFHALPIMLVLFLVVPRIGPLWAIPNQQAAKTGFSDSLSPGDLGSLALDPSPAFRVAFTGELPENNQLYWRGLVLDDFDGRTWKMRDTWGASPIETKGNNGQSLINYSIIVEPHGQPWLFSLMAPVAVSNTANSIRITPDSLLMNRIPLAQRMRYEVTSALQVRWSTAPVLTKQQRASYTRLPPASNPQARALAESWREQQLSNQQIIDYALGLFNREFSYTLRPPVLGSHSVDEFLFQSKRGFCEHFASSFSFLLRAAGIPARVVVGYQGGQWNPIENYLLVRQSDAHAWVEVWMADKGWQMIDPTAAVAPNRIEQGINDALSESDRELVNDLWQNSSLLSQLQARWDAANYVWQRWVLNYDTEAQEGLLSRLLGGTERWRLTLWLIGSGLVGTLLFAWMFNRNRRQLIQRPEIIAIKKLEQKLKPLGYNRERGETLGNFIQRVVAGAPQYTESLQQIKQLFELIAYQNQVSQLGNLEHAVKRFSK